MNRTLRSILLLWAVVAAPALSAQQSSSAPATSNACNKPEYRQFDFWVGDWNVENPSGHAVGHNTVTIEQGGCLLVEHWAGNRGGTGTSFNYYDVRDKKWHQLYLDNSGNAGAFPAMAGSLVDSKMVLLSDPNVSPLFRWSWYVLSPGRVRQMAERSDDRGKTWRIIWDSVYVKADNSASMSSADVNATPSLTAADIEQIRQLHKRYESTWLAGDNDGVRALFTSDSVLLPPHAGTPRVGRAGMDAFWFAPGPPTKVTRLEVNIKDIAGDGRIAFVWGTDEVAWVTEQNGRSVPESHGGNFLNVLRKEGSEWKIARHMWDDPVKP